MENRLTAASKTGMSAANSYDPMGRRYQKQVTGGTYAGTTVYLSSGDHPASPDGFAAASEIAQYTGGGCDPCTGPGVRERRGANLVCEINALQSLRSRHSRFRDDGRQLPH